MNAQRKMCDLDFESTDVGMEFSAGPVLITKEKILSFAREYDPLPMHMDDEFAKTHRHGKLIAPGVMTFMALWADFIRNNIWGANLLGGMSTKIEWMQPTYTDDRIRGVIKIAGKKRRNRYNGIVYIESEFFNQDDVLVMTNLTEMVIAGEER